MGKFLSRDVFTVFHCSEKKWLLLPCPFYSTLSNVPWRVPFYFSAPLIPLLPATGAIRALPQSTHYLYLSVYSECSLFSYHNDEGSRTFETSVHPDQTTRHHISEDNNLHSSKYRQSVALKLYLILQIPINIQTVETVLISNYSF